MNTPATILDLIISAVTSIGFTIAFFIAFRHTRLQGFRLLFLTSAAALALSIVQAAVTPFVLRFITPQDATGYFLGFRYVALAITVTQFAALFILVRQFFSSNRLNATPANA